MKHKVSQFFVGLTALTIMVFIVSRFFSKTPEQELFYNTYFVTVTMMFNVAIIIFYFKHRSLALFSFLQILNVIGYYVYITLLESSVLGVMLYFLVPVSFFSALGSILVAFYIALQEKYLKFLSRILLITAINNYVFYTIYIMYTQDTISGFFGPFPEDINVAMAVFYFIRDFNLTVIVGLQTVILYYLASGRKFWHYSRTVLETEEE